MKKLIICGKCEKAGVKSVLGEITPEGNFAILRFHRGYTTITGRDFAVICGNCKEQTYIRKEESEREVLNYWFSRIHWGTLSQETGTAGTESL